MKFSVSEQLIFFFCSFFKCTVGKSETNSLMHRAVCAWQPGRQHSCCWNTLFDSLSSVHHLVTTLGSLLFFWNWDFAWILVLFSYLVWEHESSIGWVIGWVTDRLSVTCQRYMQLLSCHRVLIFEVEIVVKCYWEKKFRFCDSNQAAYVLHAQRRAVEDKECYRHNWRPDTNVQQASLSEQDAAKQCVW